jgi:hypothetical protein
MTFEELCSDKAMVKDDDRSFLVYLIHATLDIPNTRLLNVDYTAQLLDAVQKNIALLDGLLVLSVLGIGSVGLHNTIHFIDHTVETTS